MTINKKGLDRFLLRSSNLAQIAVAILAIYGYFFTVVPIYQKEVLAEEIAKKQLDIDKLVKTNDDLTREIENKKSELAFVNNKSEVIILRNNELEHKNKILEQSNNDLSMEIDKRGQVLAELTHVMEVKFVDYFATMLKEYALTQYTYKNIMTPQPGNDPLESGESFIKNVIIPYDIVKACIYRDDDKEFYEKTEAIPEPIKHYVYCFAKKFLEENKELLASAVNINAAQAIIDEYNSLTLNQNKAKTFQDAMRLADVDTMYIRKIHDVLLDGRMADLKNIAIFFNKLKESAIKNIPTPNQ